MKYLPGSKAPNSGIYRCQNCGEAQEYAKAEQLLNCSCEPDKENAGWVLVDEY